MKLLLVIFGVIVGAIGAFGWLIYQDIYHHESNILFAEKTFYDSGTDGDLGAVFISGTLTGKGIEYPNNTYAVSCYMRFKACFVSYVKQIGEDQIGKMHNSGDYPIVRWEKNEVVAQEEPSISGCYRVTMMIDRQAKALLWLEEPINQTKADCRDSDATIRKYVIEYSPRWKKLFGK